MLLEAELAHRLGAAHEARFVVDEALARAGGRAPAEAGRPGGAPGAAGLDAAGLDAAGLDAAGLDAAGLDAAGLDAAVVEVARGLAERRAAGEPLQYVFGHWSFRALELVVDPRVLIPRPETEQVAEVALGEARRLGTGLVAVDVGTGSGALALSLATELGPSRLDAVWATDVSRDALTVARTNLARARRSALHPLPPVELVAGNWLEPLPARLAGRVDVVVSNPPYVTAEEWDAVDPEVRAEPRLALVAGPASDGTDGLAAVEAVVSGSLSWLRRPGAVVVELAPHQAGAARRLARSLGYDEADVVADLAGRPRILVARLAR